MLQLWARTQLGVSGVVVTDVVHYWFSCGSACYGMMVYVSGVGHLCVDSAYFGSGVVQLVGCVVGGVVGIQLGFSFVSGLSVDGSHWSRFDSHWFIWLIVIQLGVA